MRKPMNPRWFAFLVAAACALGTAAARAEAPIAAPRPVPPAPAPLAAAEAIEPNGTRLTLSPASEAIVEPGSTFRVVLPGRSDDARLSLLDGADDLVPSKGTREVAEKETVLTLAPREPLRPAARYLLRVDGARGRDLHDSAGRAAGPVEIRIVAAGSAPEPEPKAAPARRKRRR